MNRKKYPLLLESVLLLFGRRFERKMHNTDAAKQTNDKKEMRKH